VTVFSVMIILLPVGTTGIGLLYDQVLLLRARQYVTEVLPSAYTCLDIGQLADGQPVLDQATAAAVVGARFQSNLPAMLAGKLVLSGIRVGWQEIPYDPGHWMGPDQPRRLPTVTLEAVLKDRLGYGITVRDSIELLLD